MPDAASLRRTAIWLTVFGVSIYLVAPSLLEVLGSAHRIGEFTPGWLAAMLGLQVLSYFCLWELQRIAIPTASWFAVITSQLAGNGLSKIAPGGGAVGGALQY
nr:UPF0104 family protein [Thermoleophilaceae bacterium]